MAYAEDFERALQVGRPPNIQALFPNSRALIVSGKVVDRAMRAKGKAIAMAANGRNILRHPRRAAGRAAGQRRAHHRDRQVRGRAEGLLRRELLEHGAHRRRPVQRDGHHDPRGHPRRPLRHEEREGPRAGHGRDPHDVRGGHHVHRHRRVAPAQRPEPARQPRRQLQDPDVGRAGDRDRRDQGLHRPLHAGRGAVPHPGAQRARHLRRLDRAEQRHHARHRGVRRRHPGRADRRGPQGPRALQGQRRPARHLGQQLRPAARDRGQDAHHQGQRGHRPPDDLLGPRGQRLRQRAARRRRQLHQGRGRGRDRGDVGRGGRLRRRQGLEEGRLQEPQPPVREQVPARSPPRSASGWPSGSRTSPTR